MTRGDIFTESRSAEVNIYAAEVVYRGYGPTYRIVIIYILYTMVSAQQMNLLPKMLHEMTPFLPKKYIGYM